VRAEIDKRDASAHERELLMTIKTSPSALRHIQKVEGHDERLVA
jgi:hypothetical protein